MHQYSTVNAPQSATLHYSRRCPIRNGLLPILSECQIANARFHEHFVLETRFALLSPVENQPRCEAGASLNTGRHNGTYVQTNSLHIHLFWQC